MILVAVVAFAAILLARLPAAWAFRFVPAGTVACEAPAGTIWRGRCPSLAWQGVPLGEATWQLRAASLLGGRLAGHATLGQPRASVSGDFTLSPSGVLAARDVRADFELDPAVAAFFPRNLRGRIAAHLESVAVDASRRVTALQGRIDVRELRQVIGRETPLGDYELRFDEPAAPDGTITGRLRDAGGPLAVEGRLRLTPEPGYAIEGTVATRAEADPDLARQIAFLGTPDASGRRPFALSGTF